MKQVIRHLTASTNRGLTDITGAVRGVVESSGVREGLCTLFIRHTSTCGSTARAGTAGTSSSTCSGSDARSRGWTDIFVDRAAVLPVTWLDRAPT